MSSAKLKPVSNYFLYGEIDEAKAAETVKWIGEAEKGRLYIDSCGGDNSSTLTILHALNLRPDQFTLIGTGRLESNGFNLFFNFLGEKELLPNTTGMVHASSCRLQLSSSGKMKGPAHSFYKKELLREMKCDLEKLAKIGLNKSELRRYRAGEDVFIGNERMLELLFPIIKITI